MFFIKDILIDWNAIFFPFKKANESFSGTGLSE